MKAQVSKPIPAGSTFPTGMHRMRRHPIARAKPFYLRTHLSHGPSRLVTEDHRKLDAKGILMDVIDIGSTDRHSACPDQKLIRLDGRDFYVNQPELAIHFQSERFQRFIPNRLSESRSKISPIAASETCGNPLFPMMWFTSRRP